jgi:hypothetical protein
MMTMDERVEAAARRMCEVDKLAPEPDAPIIWNGKPAKAWEARVPIVLAVAEVLWPELHGDKPTHVIAPHQVMTVDVYKELFEGTHWLAPWESDGLMDDAARTATGQKWIGTEPMVLWSAMRDAYLGKGDGG